MAVQEELCGITFISFKTLISAFKGTSNPILLPCERLEACSIAKEKKYLDKVDMLVSVLASLIADMRLTNTSPEQVALIFQFISKHTLYILFHGDWKKYGSVRLHMTVLFKQFEYIANKKNLCSVALKIRSMINLFPDPWGNPILKNILDGEKCSDDELLSFFKSEFGFILIIRLELMLIARCDIQALRLVESCLACYNNPTYNCHFKGFSSQLEFTIRDLYLLLLCRENKIKKLSNEIFKMNLTEIVKLIHRCSAEEYFVGLRKSIQKMVKTVANIALVTSMIKPVHNEAVLSEMILLWFNLHADIEILFHLLKSLSLNAISSQHIYLLLGVLVKTHGKTSKSLCIQLYIRALTLNLNEIESHKSNNDHEKVQAAEISLSEGFLSLADYLCEDITTSRECVLTAFSLNPSTSCFERIRQLAFTNGLYPKIDQLSNNICDTSICNQNCEKSSCVMTAEVPVIDVGLKPIETNNQIPQSFHPSHKPASHDIDFPTEISRLNNQHNCDNNIHCSSNRPCRSGFKSNYPFMPTLIEISDAKQLCISETLHDDLLTVIGSARYQILNWKLSWEELSSRCELYKLSEKKQRSSEKELKYLNIDYGQFKNLTVPRNKKCNSSGDFEETYEEIKSSVSLDELKENINNGTQNLMEYSLNIPTRINAALGPDNSNLSESELELCNVILVYKHKKGKS